MRRLLRLLVLLLVAFLATPARGLPPWIFQPWGIHYPLPNWAQEGTGTENDPWFGVR